MQSNRPGPSLQQQAAVTARMDPMDFWWLFAVLQPVRPVQMVLPSAQPIPLWATAVAMGQPLTLCFQAHVVSLSCTQSSLYLAAPVTLPLPSMCILLYLRSFPVDS